MNARVGQFSTRCLAIIASLLVFLPAALAQERPPIQDMPNAPAIFSQQELDQMLAPIALYPDSLLSQVLMASTYPLEVVQAARWSRANPGFRGDQAVRAVESQNWDPSVKSLVAFPQVLELMDGTLEWTERLGNAFLSQEPEVWDTVQALRQRADAAGNLQSNDQFRVEQEGPTYVIEPASPDIIYVPYYDPLVVYGDWWWPGYAPMRWSPWPGYYLRSGYGRGYYWGSGISVGFGFFFGGIDWRLRHANVINHSSFYYRNINRRLPPGSGWQHDPEHRRGVPYRDPALRQQFNRLPGAPQSPDTRRDFRGRLPIAGPGNDRGDRRQPPPPAPGGNAAPVPATPPVTRPSYDPGTRQVQKYPAVQGGGSRPYPERQPQALEGVGRGEDARNASARGQASLPRPPVQQRQPVLQPTLPPPPQRAVPAPPPQPQRAAPAMPPPQRTAPAPAPQQHDRQQQAPSSHDNPRQRGEQQK